MSALPEKAGLGEQIGIAVNATSLVMSGGNESALDRVIAFGYAGADLMAAAAPGRGHLEAELAPLLWRAKYGDDITATKKAATIVITLLFLDPLYVEIERADPGAIGIFAARVMDEWLTQRCVACGGTGLQVLTPNGARVRAAGRWRSARTLKCERCAGKGLRRINEVERRRVLGADRRRVAVDEYEKLWRRLFKLTAIRLKEIATSVRAPLHSQLGRSTVAP